MTAGLAVFYIGPIVVTLYYSFTKFGVFGGTQFIGMANYVEVLTSEEARTSLINTILLTLIVCGAIPLALVIAALMNTDGLKGVAAYRTFYFLPVVTLPVAIGWLWKLILNGDFGVLNALLASIGVEGRSWLSDSATALPAVGLVGLWAGLGYPIILFVAALKGVPRELLEAAALDGAGPLVRFFRVTVPLISPTIFFVTVLTVIGALQTFDLIYVMVGKTNPALPDTQTVIYLFYKTAFSQNDKGLASALVFCLMLVIMALTAFQFRLQRRWVHYG